MDDRTPLDAQQLAAILADNGGTIPVVELGPLAEALEDAARLIRIARTGYGPDPTLWTPAIDAVFGELADLDDARTAAAAAILALLFGAQLAEADR